MYAALIGQAIISAGTYLAAKRAMVELAPLEVVLMRFALSGAVFALVLVVLPGRVLPPPDARLRVLVLGLLAGPINQGFFFYGLDRSVAAHAALLYALTPLGVYLYLLARGLQQGSLRRSAGIAVAFGGVVTLLLGRGLKEATGPLIGDLFILVGVFSWVVYTAEGKHLIDRHGAIRATAWTMGAASLMTVPLAPWVVEVDRFQNASVTALILVVYLGLMTSVVAYVLWYYALSRLEAAKVAVFSNLQPPTTAIAAWLVLGDPLTWEIWVGGALVLWGVRITQRA